MISLLLAANETVTEQQSLWITLFIPLGFLILWTLIKHVVAIARKEIEWIQFWAELPVDCLLIWATLIMSSYFIPEQNTKVIFIAFTFILLSLVIAVLICIYRSYIIDNAGNKAQPNWDKVKNHLIILWFGVFIWLLVILLLPKWDYLQAL